LIMETKVSKSQIEVWEWKEALFEDLKIIPKTERLKFINEKVKKTIEKLNQLSSKTQVA